MFRKGPHKTPGVFRTRVITDGVTPSLHAYYKHTTIKQYHKEGQALRTETTINNTSDFDIGKRLTNLPALREIGFKANRRLLDVQQISCDPIAGIATLDNVLTPIITATGQRVPPLKLAERRSHALLSALLTFRLQTDGFTNKDLRTVTAQLRGLDTGKVTVGQITYDLRRLKTRNLLSKTQGTNRYKVTDHGLETAFFLASVHDRLLTQGMADLAITGQSGRLRHAADASRKAIDDLATRAGLQLAA